MNREAAGSPHRHLVWVCSEPLNKLDAATWLETSSELCRLGWRVTLVSVGPRAERCIGGVQVLCLPKPQVYLLRQAVFHGRVLRLLAQRWSSTDVVLFHAMSAPWILPLRSVRRLMGRRRPLLVMDTRTLHMIPEQRESWKDRQRRVFLAWMEALANRSADGRTAITRRMADAVRIPPDRLWGVWPSGVNPALFAAAQAVRQWPSADEPVRLIYVGRMDYERNLMTMCRAVEEACGEGMSFAVELVGDGKQRRELQDMAERMDGRLRVRTPVPHHEVSTLLGEAHVGLLPFPDEDTFRVSSPIKLFEYMAAGMPVLATRIACHTDVVGKAGYAFWAERADVSGLLESLRQVWLQRASLGQMGQQAAAAALEWTWEEAASKLQASLECGLARST